ncbi:MAG: hypothetical protein AAGN35_01525 [Bacteroidota bacterium]
MPFTYNNKTAGDLIRSQDWNSAMAAIAALFDKLSADASIGHGHTGTPEDGPQIGTGGIADAAITLQKIADLAVSAAKLQNNAVTNSKIANGAVSSTKIATNAVNATHLASNSVSTAEIVNGSVSGAKLATGSVTNTKLGTNSVTGVKIANGTITGGKIATSSITATQLGANSVGISEIQNNAVTIAKISAATRNDIIAIAISNLSDGQTAARPSGYSVTECRFAMAINAVQINHNLTGTQLIKATVNSSGQVNIGSVPADSASGGQVTVITFARRGGW